MKGDSGGCCSVLFILICILRWKTPECVQRLAGKGDSRLWCVQDGNRMSENCSWKKLGEGWGPPACWTSAPSKPTGESWCVVERQCMRWALLACMFSMKRQAGEPLGREGRRWRLLECGGSGVAPEGAFWELVKALLRLAFWL